MLLSPCRPAGRGQGSQGKQDVGKTSGKGSQKVWAPSQLRQPPITDLSVPLDSLSAIKVGPFLASSLSLQDGNAKAFNTPVIQGHIGLVAKGPGQMGSALLQARPRPRLPRAPKTTTSGSGRVQRPCLSIPPFLCLCHKAPDCCSLDLGADVPLKESHPWPVIWGIKPIWSSRTSAFLGIWGWQAEGTRPQGRPKDLSGGDEGYGWDSQVGTGREGS